MLQHDCDNIEVTAPDLAITKLVLEVDSRWSDYGRCNICGPNGEPHPGVGREHALQLIARAAARRHGPPRQQQLHAGGLLVQLWL